MDRRGFLTPLDAGQECPAYPSLVKKYAYPQKTMKLIESTYTTPEEMLAQDEHLLKAAETGALGESLRFWEAEEYFAVIGRAGKLEEECFTGRCKKDNIKILRRSSGGHAVLQGPGCLNYSMILSYGRDERFKEVRESYGAILNRLKDALKIIGQKIEFFPLADLALNGRKISGNAQARKRRFFLHHGTILFDFDIDKVSFYLKHPPTEPEYRRNRTHKDFLANISASSEEIKEMIKEEFIGSPARLPVL